MTFSTPKSKKGKSYTEEDLKWLKFIAGLKWKDGFICKKEDCGNKTCFPGKSPYSKRCAKCDTHESATAHTAFHHQKLPISKMIKILQLLVDMLDEYNNLMETTFKKVAKEGIRLRKTPIRASSVYIADVMKMHQRTVFLILSRFMNRLPEIHTKTFISDQWFRGVKDRSRYVNLYAVLERGETVKGIVELSVLKDVPSR